MTSSRKPIWLAVVAGAVILLGAGYAMGRKNMNINPLAIRPLAAAPLDSTGIAKASFQKCGELQGDLKVDCYAKPLDSLATRGEVRKAMGTLSQLGIIDVDAKRDGHVYAHGIGIAAGKAGKNVATTFAKCDESNQSGCYHGVIQAYFDAVDTIGPSQVNALCQDFRGPQGDRWLRFQCVHGMGHGLMAIYKHDVPKALTTCDYLDDDWDRRSCYGGTFMESVINFTMPHHPSHGLGAHSAMNMRGMHDDAPAFKAIDPKDPLYPCSVMAEKYLVSCYEMQTAVILYLNHGNLGAAAKTCDTAPFKMRFVCYQSLGRDISSYALQDHAKSIQFCSLGTPKYQPWCYFGLVKNFVDINARPSEGLSFCKDVPGDLNKAKCYEAVGEQIAALKNDNEVRKQLCQPSEPAYLGACLFGARVSSDLPKDLETLYLVAAKGS